MAKLNLLVLALLACYNTAWGGLREEFVTGIDEFGNKLTNCSMCDYVYRDDGWFSWEYMFSEYHPGVNSYWLNVTSQKWKDESWTNQPVWWHWVVVHVPVSIRFLDSALMYVTFGSNDKIDPPDWDFRFIERTAKLSVDLGVMTIVVNEIPNQPLIYTDDPRQQERSEDNSIAYTWRVFLDQAFNASAGGAEPDPEVVLRNPMCKGVIKSMDAVEEFVQQQYSYTITQWMMVGESKRGWTTWIASAMEERVVAMVPAVLSSLNMVESFHHYYQSYDGWPFYFWDYWSQGIMQFINDPEIYQLEEIADPFSYRRGMTMPKLIVSASSDEFFLLDDTWYFMDQLPGETHFWLLENSGHEIKNAPRYDEYWEMLGTFFLSVILGQERPSFEEQMSTDGNGGSIYIRTPLDWVPLEVVGYWADSVVSHRRDWRLVALNYTYPNEIETGIWWETAPIRELGNHIYQLEMDLPAEGYRAFYMMVTWAGPEGRNYTWSTQTHVIPEGMPYPKCTDRLSCHGVLR